MTAYIFQCRSDLLYRCIYISTTSAANKSAPCRTTFSTPTRRKKMKPMQICTLFTSTAAIAQGKFSFGVCGPAPHRAMYTDTHPKQQDLSSPEISSATSARKSSRPLRRTFRARRQTTRSPLLWRACAWMLRSVTRSDVTLSSTRTRENWSRF